MKIYQDRLKKLSATLKKVPSVLFNIDTYVNCRPSKIEELYELDRRCGGTACPIGWLPKVFPADFYVDETTYFKDNLFFVKPTNNLDLWDAIRVFFGIDDYDIASLFTREGYSKYRVSPRDVVEKLNYFIRTQT